MGKGICLKHTVVLLAIALVLPLAGCGKFSLYSSNKEDVIASVGEKQLFMTDIERMLTPEMSAEDSTAVINAVRTSWVRAQIKLQAAETALSDDERDIDALVEEYRTSLLIYKYETEYVDRTLDTSVTAQQINDYYGENRDNFRLAGPVVKARIVRLPAQLRQGKKLEELFKSPKEEEQYEFQNIAERNNYRTYDFTQQWVDFNSLLQYIPFSQTDIDGFLNSKKYYEVEDDQYKYLMKIESFRPTGDYSPLEKENENIRKILLNRRRNELLRALEDSLYNKAVGEHIMKINQIQ